MASFKFEVDVTGEYCRRGQYVWEDHRPRSGRWKGTSGGEVVSFSGCDDYQTSADTWVMIIDLPLFACSICCLDNK